jgi:hypothetical protein
MLKESMIGIYILGREGASVDSMMASDLIIDDINDALDLLFETDRLIAMLRKQSRCIREGISVEILIGS